MTDRALGALAYRRARRHTEHEQDDPCGDGLMPPDTTPAPVANIAGARVGDTLPGGGVVLKQIAGAGKVYDWRTSSWTPSNGGKIKPLGYVQHIPVVSNVPGIADFITLRNVLVEQGLMVQSATDREGNVALFCPFDILCYHARGGNQQMCGNENMHATTSEEWTKRQLRAAAWLAQLAERKHGIPLQMAQIGDGEGVVRVQRRGHTSHQRISDAAGFHDRTDPGTGFDYEYVFHAARHFKAYGSMERA